MSLLLWVLFLPLIGVFLLLFVPAWNERLIRGIGFATSLLTFVISLLLWIEFDASSGRFQFVNSFSFVRHASSPPIELVLGSAKQAGDTMGYSGGEYTTLSFVMGLDGISLFFVVLTTFLDPSLYPCRMDNNQNFCERILHSLSCLRSTLDCCFLCAGSSLVLHIF